jgi:cation transport ATPase
MQRFTKVRKPGFYDALAWAWFELSRDGNEAWQAAVLGVVSGVVIACGCALLALIGGQ